ncbi:MAG: FtsX-like permease family protein [Acidobacteriota bacterium]
MFFYLRLGIRNLFRNKRRALIAGTAIGIGLAALMFSDALIKGMEENLIESATESYLGDGQIHRDGYRTLPEVDKTIEGQARLAERLRSDPRVQAFTERVMSFAMITSPANLSAIQLVGVNPETERELSQIDESIVQGGFFSGGDGYDLVIGDRLADLLEAEIGSRIVITVAQAGTGELSQAMFRVSGIFHLNIADMDRGMGFVRLGRAQQMLGLGDRIHEIALRLRETSYAEQERSAVWRDYSTGGNEAVGWWILLPQLKMALELSQFSLLIIGLILFAIVALGILNTLFMSMHERMFEFGVLRALGTRPRAMAALILFEAAALAAVAVVLGVLFGALAIGIFRHLGIDYTGIEAMGVTFRRLLYPQFQLRQFIVYPLVVFGLTLLISLYPAGHAARLQPADAMRRSF